MYRGPFLSILLLSCFYKGYGTIFEKQPGSATRLLGDSLDIPCVTRETKSLVIWQTVSDGISFWNSQEHFTSLGAETRYQIIGTGDQNFTLRIKQVQINEPNLQCVVFGASEQSSPSNITVVAAPYDGYPTCSASSNILSVGSTLDLTCTSAGGVPAAALKWKDGVEYLSEGPGIKQDTDANGREGRKLVHNFKVNENHDGKRFTCTAENIAISMLYGRGELPANRLSCVTKKLNVTYGPKTTTIGPADPYIIIEDRDAVIRCKAFGGNPDVYQFRYRQPTESWSQWTDMEERKYKQLRRDQMGVYSCQSKNSDSVGLTIKQLTLETHYPPESITISAAGVNVGQSYAINEGADLVLDCNASGGSPAVSSYSWTDKEGDIIAQNTARLSINNISRTRAGTYRCTATNMMTPTNQATHVGSAAKSVLIKVLYVPERKSVVPQTLRQAAAIGQEISLFVEIIAEPLAEMKWERLMGGFFSKLPSSGFGVQSTNLSSKLIIGSVAEDLFGNYTFTATNTVGLVRVTFLVTQQVAPKPPSNLRVSATAISITVEWDRGWNGGLEQTFHLRYSGGTLNIPDSTAHHKVKLNADDGIIQSTEYTIVLSAENSKGSSPTRIEKATTKAKPAVDTEGTVATIDKENGFSKIRWSVYNSESFDRILVTVCEINSEECMEHNITNTNDASRIALPTGSTYQFSFSMYDAEELVSTQRNVIVIGDGGSGSNDTIIIVVVVVLLLIVGCSIALGCFIWRRSKKTGRERREVEMSGCLNRGLPARPGNHEIRNSSEPPLRDDATEYEQTHPEYVNQHLEKSQYAMLKPLNNPEKQEVVYEEVKPKGCECSLDDVKQESMVYRCDLYEVYQGTAIKLEGVKPGTMVLVKTSKGGTPPIVQSIILNEIKALRAVGSHPNVVSIFAQCTFSEPVLMVLKTERHGRLDVYLDGPGRDIAQEMLKTMSIDVVKGMSYLADLKPDILHYCLAAKHIMVSDTVSCKVSGFGFADHVLEKEEYERATGLEQDVRWMAPEQLRHNIHSKKSDIWAYAVLMWEIYSYGQTPYPDMPSDEVKQHVLSGSVLGRPTTLPAGMYQTMLECLRNEEQERPNFQQLLRTLEHME